MSTATLVSIREYLSTTYHPDCDYVDGVLVERNVGQKDHSKLQGRIYAWFFERRRALRTAHPGVRQTLPYPWVLDPPSRRAWHVTSAGHLEALDGILRTRDGKVVLPITDLFLD